jgi:hypothetical protein
LPLEIQNGILYNQYRPRWISLSVYNPTGSGSVHTDKVISGGRQKVAAKKANPFAKKAAAGKVPVKKVAAKKAAPFPKKMSDAACPPGSMSSAGMGKSAGLGAAKKVAKKAAPKAMGEVPNGKVATPRQQRALSPGKRTNRVGVTAGKRTNRITKGTNGTSGSLEN